MISKEAVDLVRMIELVRRAEEQARIRALYHPTMQMKIEEQKRAQRLHQQAAELKARLY